MSSWCSVGVIAKMLVNSTSEDFELDDERFSQMVSEAQIRERKVTRVPKKTREQNGWALNTWSSWADWRNEKMLREGSAEDLFKKVPHLSVEIPTECGSKSIKIDFSTMSMEISVD